MTNAHDEGMRRVDMLRAIIGKLDGDTSITAKLARSSIECQIAWTLASVAWGDNVYDPPDRMGGEE